jgi:tetratricopeptide (TPR) repeat protein
MPLVRLLFVALFLLCTALDASTASADPLAGSCDDYAVCAALAAEAREHSQAGRYEEAKRAYLQAYQRRADPRLLYNLARVMHKAGRSYEAATYYKAYIDAGAEGNQDQRQKAEHYLAQARSEAAASEKPANLEFSTAQPSPDAPKKTPIYRKWWLWTAVGAGVAAIAIGVGLGLASQRPDSTGAVEARPF